MITPSLLPRLYIYIHIHIHIYFCIYTSSLNDHSNIMMIIQMITYLANLHAGHRLVAHTVKKKRGRGGGGGGEEKQKLPRGGGANARDATTADN